MPPPFRGHTAVRDRSQIRERGGRTCQPKSPPPNCRSDILALVRCASPAGGVWGPPRDESEAITLLRRVVDRGVIFIDTADSYGPGTSETLIAKALYPYPAELVVATKGGLTRPGPDRWVADCRPEHLRRACADSLRRLRLERIGLY